MLREGYLVLWRVDLVDSVLLLLLLQRFLLVLLRGGPSVLFADSSFLAEKGLRADPLLTVRRLYLVAVKHPSLPFPCLIATRHPRRLCPYPALQSPAPAV